MSALLNIMDIFLFCNAYNNNRVGFQQPWDNLDLKFLCDSINIIIVPVWDCLNIIFVLRDSKTFIWKT